MCIYNQRLHFQYTWHSPMAATSQNKTNHAMHLDRWHHGCSWSLYLWFCCLMHTHNHIMPILNYSWTLSSVFVGTQRLHLLLYFTLSHMPKWHMALLQRCWGLNSICHYYAYKTLSCYFFRYILIYYIFQCMFLNIWIVAWNYSDWKFKKQQKNNQTKNLLLSWFTKKKAKS